VSRAVLDTSAVLALCFAEAGAEQTIARGRDGLLSAVNYSEAIAKATDYGVPAETVNRALASLKPTVVPFDEEHAQVAASFRPLTRGMNVSFADRACLSAAAVSGLPVLTGDRKWEDIKCSVTIMLIR
jgi:PIN domain nuclease of toxin-antitoxin system